MMTRSALAAVALIAFTAFRAAAGEPPGEAVAAWNERLLAVAEAEDGFLTLKGLHAAAMMHLAMHDALAALDGRFEPYLGLPPEPGADPVAAVAQAGWEVAVDQYPDQRAGFTAERNRWLGAAGAGAPREAGVALGRAAARQILDARKGDGWNAEAEYRWHPMGPGVYAEFAEHSGTPQGFVFGAGWAIAKPFLLDRPSQFRAPPPPAIASDAYAEAYREVKEVGRYRSPARTADQTHLAMWWKDFVESSHNRLARQLVRDERLDLTAAARLFALLETAVYDAYVDVFDNKFHFNHWRPYTAIRWAAHDGNPKTEADPEWNNTHRHTYAFPSYPSAHGTVCAAAATVLADTFGDDHPFTMTTERVDRAGPGSEKIAMDPPTRSFPSFSAAAEECSLSRVYLGIHFRYDSIAGTALGRQVGRYAVEHYLRPVAGKPSPPDGQGLDREQGRRRVGEDPAVDEDDPAGGEVGAHRCGDRRGVRAARR